MPTNKLAVQYKDGDIVEVPYLRARGIIFIPSNFLSYSCTPDEHETDLDGWYKDVKKFASGKSYAVMLFGQNGKNMLTIFTKSQIRPCRGLTKPDLCNNCVNRFECFTTRGVEPT